MQIVENKKLEVLNQIDLGNLLENTRPETFRGQDTLKQLVERFNNKKDLTITEIAKISTICKNITEDVAIFNIGETISETLSSSLDSVLLYILEGIEYRVDGGDRLAENLQEKAISILEMSTLKEKQTAVRNGMLNAFQTIHEGVGIVRKMCEIRTKTKHDTSIFEAYNPIVYTEKGANNTTFLRLQGITFGINENAITQTHVVPSQRFVNLSNAVSELKYDGKLNAFVYENRALGKFEINESFIKHNDSVMYGSNNDFSTKLGVIVESVSENQREKQVYRSVLESLLSVKMNFDSFVQCDNIAVIENKQNGDKFAVMVMEGGKSYFSVLKSARYPQTTNVFESTIDMLDFAKAKTGYDASKFFLGSVVTEKQHVEQTSAINENYDILINELGARRLVVENSIIEAKKEGVDITKLEETLAVIDAIIIEQKENYKQATSK